MKKKQRLLIKLAKKHNVCLIPFGGGTSVSNALKIPKNEKRMVVSVDTRRMNKIESIDEENLLATVQSGILGVDLENELQKLAILLDTNLIVLSFPLLVAGYQPMHLE